jgi:hypothetical protein
MLEAVEIDPPIRTALEAAGVKFIDANGGGSGLRIGEASM